MKVFVEEQFVKRWWLFMFILAIILVIIGTAYYATRTAEEETAIVISVVSIIITLAIIVPLLRLRLNTRIDEKGILTYFRPFHFTRKFLPWEDINECFIRKYSPMEEFGGWGLRGLGRNWKAYNVEGNYGIQIRTFKGKKVLIGTLKPKEAEAVVNYYHRTASPAQE